MQRFSVVLNGEPRSTSRASRTLLYRCVPAQTPGGIFPFRQSGCTVNSVTPDLDELYRRARAANAAVPATKAAYDQATAHRVAMLGALRDQGESVGRIAARLGMSKTRVDQLLAKYSGRDVSPSAGRERMNVSSSVSWQVACPSCDAPPGEPCKSKAGRDAPRVHTARWEAWREQEGQ